MKIWNKKLKIRKEPKLMQINVEEFKWDINVCVKEHIIHAHYVNTEHNKSKYIFMWYKKNLQKNSTQTHASGILFLGKSIYHPHWGYVNAWNKTITQNTPNIKNVEKSKWSFLPRKTVWCMHTKMFLYNTITTSISSFQMEF